MTPVLSRGQFTGHCLARREAGGITLSDYAFPPGHVAPAHTHQQPHFYLVLRGSFRERCDGKERDGSASSLFFCPAGEQHVDFWNEQGGRCFNVEFTPERAAQIREYTSALERSAVVREAPLVGLALRLHAEFRRRDRAALLAAEGIILEFLAAAGRCPVENAAGAPPRWLREARELVADRYAEELTLVQIAAQVGVHPAHLARMFRRHYRCTVGEFQRQQRQEFARAALAGSDRPLLEIALAAGYSDQSHFTTAFRREMGVTPAAYRRAFRS